MANVLWQAAHLGLPAPGRTTRGSGTDLCCPSCAARAGPTTRRPGVDEKTSLRHELQALHEEFEVSAPQAGGSPPLLASEFLAEALEPGFLRRTCRRAHPHPAPGDSPDNLLSESGLWGVSPVARTRGGARPRRGPPADIGSSGKRSRKGRAPGVVGPPGVEPGSAAYKAAALTLELRSRERRAPSGTSVSVDSRQGLRPGAPTLPAGRRRARPPERRVMSRRLGEALLLRRCRRRPASRSAGGTRARPPRRPSRAPAVDGRTPSRWSRQWPISTTLRAPCATDMKHVLHEKFRRSMVS